MPGVRSVTSGFHRGLEVNTVRFDAAKVSIESLEATLRRAGTYIKTFAD